MTRIPLLLILTLLIYQGVNAAPIDTLLIFYKNTGRVVNTKDSADYFRFIMPPDTSVDKEEYRVADFYINGKKKMVGTSLTSSLNPVFDGSCVYYFPNGKRRSIITFKNGRLIGTSTSYYPNGKIYNILKFDFDSYDGESVDIVEWRDSTGNLLVVKGTGHIFFYDDDFKKIVKEGDVLKNKFNGEWNGLIGDTARYVCTYRKGVLKSGTSYLKSGKQYTFTHFFTDPVFNAGGSETFYEYIQKNLHYPDVDKKHKITGTVRVSYTIDSSGMTTNVKILSGLMPSLDEEALRVVRSVPLWIPATQYGIPISVTTSTGVYF